jgi:hypothetical protein
VEGFQPSTYTLLMHRDSRFPLLGAHAAVPCDSCHSAAAGASPIAARASKANFHFTALECAACHKDPHELSKPRDCATCHSENTWRRIAAFDHSTTSFTLEGAHKSATCLACHKPQALAALRPRLLARRTIFKEAGSNCSDCHEDVHGGQFVRNGEKAGCQVCHTNEKWRPPLFDHDKSSTFALTGAHEKVPCRQCHSAVAEINGRHVRMYRSDSRRCEDCH